MAGEPKPEGRDSGSRRPQVRRARLGGAASRQAKLCPREQGAEHENAVDEDRAMNFGPTARTRQCPVRREEPRQGRFRACETLQAARNKRLALKIRLSAVPTGRRFRWAIDLPSLKAKRLLHRWAGPI